MGNSGSSKVPELYKGQLCDVRVEKMWYPGVIQGVDEKQTVTVSLQENRMRREIDVPKGQWKKKLAFRGTHTKGIKFRPPKDFQASQASLPTDDGDSTGNVKTAKVVKSNGNDYVPTAAVADLDDFETDEEILERVKLVSEYDSGREQMFDVLDKSQPLEPFDPLTQVGLKDGHVPPAPEGGWRWRPAVATGETEEGQILVKFLDTESMSRRWPKKMLIDISDDEIIAEYQTMSSPQIIHHDYQVGDPLDVEDHYWPKNRSKGMKKKWRKCQVTHLSGQYFIRVTFVGWSKAYDQWFHVLVQAVSLHIFS